MIQKLKLSRSAIAAGTGGAAGADGAFGDVTAAAIGTMAGGADAAVAGACGFGFGHIERARSNQL